MNTLQFCRYRWYFRTLDAVRFPRGQSANTIRGAFGTLLRQAAPPTLYRRLWEPGNSPQAPSGLADWPRPFLFRTMELDALNLPPGAAFSFDTHLFDLDPALARLFGDILRQVGAAGVGPGRGRANLERIEQLDLEDQVTASPCMLSFDPAGPPADHLRLRFLTPTELKTEGGLAHRPEFAVLFARLRDRISTLSALYGAGPLAVDFRAMGDRAATVRLTRCDIAWTHGERRSSRTGQTHPLGGFTGEAEYEGQLAEFLPWLRAARWTGVGRQTVWGKGDVRVIP